MVIEELRKLVVNPMFEPFSIHVSDGRRLPVIGRDFILLPPDGSYRNTVFIYQKEGNYDIVDASFISSVGFDKDQVKLQPAGI